METVERALQLHGAPVYVRRQIVHNAHVVRDLERRGAVFVRSEEDAPQGSLLGNVSHLHLPIWALMAWMIVLGTIVPFFLIVGSMRHITATRAGILAMVEPVVASLVAYGWLNETLGETQLVGGAIVLVGILLAQSAR